MQVELLHLGAGRTCGAEVEHTVDQAQQPPPGALQQLDELAPRSASSSGVDEVREAQAE